MPRRGRSRPAFRTGSTPHVQLLYDLQLLAYQADLTRVITFMYGREQTGRPYPQIGVPEPHHPLTHHQNDPAKMEKCAKIQHVSREAVRGLSGEAAQHARRRRLAARPRDASLRRRASATATATRTARCRRCCVGGGAGAIKGGRHLVYPEHTPLTNLQLTLLNMLGVPAEKLGDSTGQFKELSGVASA